MQTFNPPIKAVIPSIPAITIKPVTSPTPTTLYSQFKLTLVMKINGNHVQKRLNARNTILKKIILFSFQFSSLIKNLYFIFYCLIILLLLFVITCLMGQYRNLLSLKEIIKKMIRKLMYMHLHKYF